MRKWVVHFSQKCHENMQRNKHSVSMEIIKHMLWNSTLQHFHYQQMHLFLNYAYNMTLFLGRGRPFNSLNPSELHVANLIFQIRFPEYPSFQMLFLQWNLAMPYQVAESISLCAWIWAGSRNNRTEVTFCQVCTQPLTEAVPSSPHLFKVSCHAKVQLHWH